MLVSQRGERRMIELLRERIASTTDRDEKVNLIREALQLAFLKIIQDKNYFSNLAFVGGTSLRIIYNMNRFSEDLDFSLIKKNGYDFLEIVSVLEKGFKLYGLNILQKTKADKTVQGSMLKFPGLLRELGLSPLANENLSIKFEIDSNPPSGWKIENTLINKMYVMNITHFTLSSQFATKLHACFFRKYVKGRDFYDFMWYLGKKIKPNYELLNNAIEQTHGNSPGINEDNIKDFLLKELQKIDFGLVKKDVERFLENKEELKLLDKTVFSKTVEDLFGKS